MKSRGVRVAAVLSAGMLLVVGSACSFSRSSGASSRSSSSPSRSSSRSSKHDERSTDKKQQAEVFREVETALTAFQEEIAAIAVLYAGSNGTAEDFQRDLTAAAKRNGVPYWELDERVFTAIGVGLERAGVEPDAIESLPFLQRVRNAEHFDAIGNAYGGGR